jgi:hypothetical protein
MPGHDLPRGEEVALSDPEVSDYELALDLLRSMVAALSAQIFALSGEGTERLRSLQQRRATYADHLKHLDPSERQEIKRIIATMPYTLWHIRQEASKPLASD